MKNPFPGMNPYLESRWSSVHGMIISYIRDELNVHLPENYRAEAEQGLRIQTEGGHYLRTIRPDVQIQHTSDFEGGGVATEVLPAEPTVIEYLSDEILQRVVEIQDLSDGARVVTAIELLSAENKHKGEGRAKYFQKMREYAEAEVSVVEYDLLRAGERIRSVEGAEEIPYSATVYRHGIRYRAEFYAISLRSHIPAIRVPLRAGDKDVVLNIQPLLNRAYANGRYRFNYNKPPEPPLSPVDAEWAKSLTDLVAP